MQKRVELKYLLRLLDDDTPVVREGVAGALLAYGADVFEALRTAQPPPTQAQLRVIEDLIEPLRRDRLYARWAGLLGETPSPQPLEAALALLSQYQSGLTRPTPLSQHLEALAEAFRAQGRRPEPARLSRFLFEEVGLTGAKGDYYHSRHSDLVAVIEEGRGLPISLALIYVLVGGRLGLAVEPCSLPYHFCARFRRGERLYIVDGYHGAAPLPESVFLTRNVSSRDWLPVLLRLEVAPAAIVSRVLRNLARAYRERGRMEIADGVSALPVPGTRELSGRASRPGKWAEGRLVRHRANLYRGVIVETDVEPAVLATDREPWHRVLVDGQGAIMRVRQSALTADDSGRPVDHPLVPFFFSRFVRDRYERNAQAWPSV